MSVIRFLVADSSPALHTFLRQLFEGYGFEPGSIKTAHTPQAALEMAADHPPHLLLTDSFPKEVLSGLALQQALQQQHPLCRWGLMGAQMDTALKEQAQAAGALFLLDKPFTAADIKTAVAQALDTLAAHHPLIAQQLRRQAKGRTVAMPPRLQAGDAVLYQGRYETVKTVILRQGELVVHLAGTPGMVPASKLSKP